MTASSSLQRLRDAVLEHPELAELDVADRRLALRRLAASIAPHEEIAALVGAMADEIDGNGPLTSLLEDVSVTDVLVNGPREIWVERVGRPLERSEVSFPDDASLFRFVSRTLGRAGVTIDATHPIADGRLPNGSRIHAVLPPIAPEGVLVSIRRFPQRALTVHELVSRGMASASEAAALQERVALGQTIGICGGTGTGKTTLMNALLASANGDRIVIVEETPELHPVTAHAVRLVARSANVEGRGAVPLAVLVRAALRMRPDRIVIGEVRGREALVALTAMTTGHRGSMVTLHAPSAEDFVDRFVSLAMEAGSGLTEASLAARVRRAFDVVVHLERRDGRRVVSSVVEL